MVILISQNKITNFLMILASASTFKKMTFLFQKIVKDLVFDNPDMILKHKQHCNEFYFKVKDKIN